LVYIIPPLVIIAGAFILYRALRAWKQAPAELPEQNQPEDEPDDEYVARIEEELSKR
jgi:threonine/homoserine/homoserine lactone efflux protein